MASGARLSCRPRRRLSAFQRQAEGWGQREPSQTASGKESRAGGGGGGGGGAGAGAAEAGAGAWLLGALAVLASSPELAQRCVVPGPHAKRGVLALRLWNTDRWSIVLTDDRLPCDPDGRLVYGGCADPQHVIFALLLKGYAKLYGSYAALRAGRVTEALVDLTGGLAGGRGRPPRLSTAPRPASLDRPKARAAPTHPSGAPPEQLGGSPWPQQPISGRFSV